MPFQERSQKSPDRQAALDAKQSALGGRRQLGPQQSLLIQDKDLPPTAKAKIGHTARNEDFPQESTTRGPDTDAIARSTVHVSIDIALDSIGNARIHHGKHAPISEKGLPSREDNVKSVSVFQPKQSEENETNKGKE